jgi:hypothetical protein
MLNPLLPSHDFQTRGNVNYGYNHLNEANGLDQGQGNPLTQGPQTVYARPAFIPQPVPQAALPYVSYNQLQNTQAETQQYKSNPTYIIVYRILFNILLPLALLVTMFVFLGESHAEGDGGACGKDFWSLMLTRIICGFLEWLIMLVSGVSVPPQGSLMIFYTLYKLAFAIALTVVVPAAVSGGCADESRSWYALIVFGWIFLVIDWIIAVSGCINVVASGGIRRQQK